MLTVTAPERPGPEARRVLQALLIEPGPGSHVWAIVDAAADPDAVDRLYASRSAQFDVLWSGDPEPDVFEVSPFLVDFSADPALAQWLIDGWGAGRTVFVRTSRPFDSACRHLRRFTEAIDPDGRVLICRFYDPQVLPELFAVLDAAQLERIFEDVEEFVAEDVAGGGLVRVGFAQGRLQVSREPLPGMPARHDVDSGRS